MRLSDVHTPLAGTGLDAASRIDPLYDGLWVQGSQGAWARAGEVRRQAAAGLGKLPAILTMDEEEAWASVLSNYRWDAKLAVLSAVDAYRTATVEQVQAITGVRTLTSAEPVTLSALFSAGLIDLGRSVSVLTPTLAGRVGYLVRPARTKAFEHRLARHLTYPEMVATTGGLGWMSGGFYDRHNTLSTELNLRVAEMCEIGTVLGEKFSNHDLLFGTGVGRAPIEVFARGDGLIVRADGLRIVIEVTASLKSSSQADTDRKFTRWTRAFDDQPFDSDGVVVVFVTVNSPDAGSDQRVSQTHLRSRLADAIRSYPGSGRVRTRARVFTADWSDWFPAPGEVDPGFFTLRVKTVPTRDGEEPASVDLLNPFDVSFEPRFDATALIDNAAGLKSVPVWLREGRRPAQVIDQMTADAGLDPVPVAPSPRAGHAVGGRGGDNGAIDPSRPPFRLRTTTDNDGASRQSRHRKKRRAEQEAADEALIGAW